MWRQILAMLLISAAGSLAATASAKDYVSVKLTRTVASPLTNAVRGEGILDLRALPSGTRPSELRLDVQKKEGISSPVYASLMINGALLARSEITGPTGTIRIGLKDRQLSLQNRLEVTLDQMGGADFAVIKPLRVMLSQASTDPRHFYQLATLFRSGVKIVATPSNAIIARRVLDRLAPNAPVRDGGHELVVSDLPPRGTAPWLRFDRGAVRLVTRNGLALYTQEQLNRMTIVQIVTRGNAPILWIKPAHDEAMPTLLPLDYGNVALFHSKGAEMAFSTFDDPIVQAAYRNEEAASSALFRTWRSSVLAVWVALTIGAGILMLRLPRLRPRMA